MCVCVYIYKNINIYTHNIFRGFLLCPEKESIYIGLWWLFSSHLIPPVCIQGRETDCRIKFNKL